MPPLPVLPPPGPPVSGLPAAAVARLCDAARAVALAELARRVGGRPSPAALERKLVEGLRELNALLTTERAARPGAYLAEPRLQLAYLVHHFPMHAAKVAALVAAHLPPEFPLQGPLRVLDVGAGPLSAAAGVALARPGPLVVHALDLATTMMRLGLPALRALGGPDLHVELETAPASSAPGRARAFQPHLCVLANVLGEVGRGPGAPEERAALLRALLDALPPEAHLLVLEPGTRIHGQALVRVRERVLQGGGVHVHGPCVGAPECPLRGGPDWCHADLPLRWPPAYQETARAAGLRPEHPHYAYLWLSRSPPPARPAGALRVIGGVMRPPDGRLLRYACGPQGRVTLGTAGPGAAGDALAAVTRGALLVPPVGVRVDRGGQPAREDPRSRGPRPSGRPRRRR